MWNPPWRAEAEKTAQANGWALIEQADGRLAFETRDAATRSTIIFTGNEADVSDAIARAASALNLQAGLKGSTAKIAAAVPIAKAIIDGKRAMSLSEKMGTLAVRAKAVPLALEARADALLPRLDALEKTGGAAFAGLEAIAADAEAGVSAAEGALRQLTNGGPLSGSAGSQAGD